MSGGYSRFNLVIFLLLAATSCAKRMNQGSDDLLNLNGPQTGRVKSEKRSIEGDSSNAQSVMEKSSPDEETPGGGSRNAQSVMEKSSPPDEADEGDEGNSALESKVEEDEAQETEEEADDTEADEADEAEEEADSALETEVACPCTSNMNGTVVVTGNDPACCGHSSLFEKEADEADETEVEADEALDAETEADEADDAEVDEDESLEAETEADEDETDSQADSAVETEVEVDEALETETETDEGNETETLGFKCCKGDVDMTMAVMKTVEGTTWINPRQLVHKNYICKQAAGMFKGKKCQAQDYLLYTKQFKVDFGTNLKTLTDKKQMTTACGAKGEKVKMCNDIKGYSEPLAMTMMFKKGGKKVSSKSSITDFISKAKALYDKKVLTGKLIEDPKAKKEKAVKAKKKKGKGKAKKGNTKGNAAKKPTKTQEAPF